MKAVIDHEAQTVTYNDGTVGVQDLRNAFQALLDVKVECMVFNHQGMAWCLNKSKKAPHRVALALFGMPVDSTGIPMADDLTELVMFDIVVSHLPLGWGLVLIQGGPAVRKNRNDQIEAFRRGDWRPF
jgi:hypothetical protein